jgi:hypothetical protein
MESGPTLADIPPSIASEPTETPMQKQTRVGEAGGGLSLSPSGRLLGQVELRSARRSRRPPRWDPLCPVSTRDWAGWGRGMGHQQ